MKKPYKNTQLSDKKCQHPDCRKRLKLNLLARKPNASYCFAHWAELVRGNPRYKNGKKLPAKQY